MVRCWVFEAGKFSRLNGTRPLCAFPQPGMCLSTVSRSTLFSSSVVCVASTLPACWYCACRTHSRCALECVPFSRMLWVSYMACSRTILFPCMCCISAWFVLHCAWCPYDCRIFRTTFLIGRYPRSRCACGSFLFGLHVLLV